MCTVLGTIQSSSDTDCLVETASMITHIFHPPGVVEMSQLHYGPTTHHSEKTIFTSFNENRGVATFKEALESSPDILGFLKTVNRGETGEVFFT